MHFASEVCNINPISLANSWFMNYIVQFLLLGHLKKCLGASRKAFVDYKKIQRKKRPLNVCLDVVFRSGNWNSSSHL